MPDDQSRPGFFAAFTRPHPYAASTWDPNYGYAPPQPPRDPDPNAATGEYRDRIADMLENNPRLLTTLDWCYMTAEQRARYREWAIRDDAPQVDPAAILSAVERMTPQQLMRVADLISSASDRDYVAPGAADVPGPDPEPWTAGRPLDGV